MAGKKDDLNIDKLVFKKEYKEAGRILVIAKNKKRYKMEKEQIMAAVKAGAHRDKLHAFFTPESLEEAKKKASE